MPKDRPFWEMRFCENYSKDTSLLVVRIHHSFTDALGFLSLCSLVNDEKFKLKMASKFPKPNFFINILFKLVAPFIIFSKAPEAQGYKTDDQAAKIRELTEKDCGRAKLYATKGFKFSDLRQCYRRFAQTTFNDYSLGILSKSLYEWYKVNGITGVDRIVTTMPTNIRELPKTVDEINLDNNIVGFKFFVPIREKLEEGIKETKNVTKKYLTLTYIGAIMNFMKIVKYLPQKAINFFVEDMSRNTDIVYSNIPFSQETFYF